MRNDPSNPFFDVWGTVHVRMYACACVRVCVCVCVRAYEMWMRDVTVSKIPRILNLLLPTLASSFFHFFLQVPLPLTPFPYPLAVPAGIGDRRGC